jgi:two-component system CheB/CheR fusion protein
MRVLIADDCPDNRDSLAILLRALGYEVHTAPNGSAALQEFQVFRPQAAILDLAMPGMTGWQLARQIRQEQTEATVLLIALSGHAGEQDQEQSRQAGFDAHLGKPTSLSELQRLLAGGAGS